MGAFPLESLATPLDQKIKSVQVNKLLSQSTDALQSFPSSLSDLSLTTVIHKKKLEISVFPKKSEQIQFLFSYNLLFGVFVYLISSFQL